MSAPGSRREDVLHDIDRSRVRLTDLAEKAGVSTATVSRVLNGKGTVAADTRKAVFDALDELGYRRPPRAQPHSEGLVGVVLPDLENPAYPVLLQVLEGALSRHGFAPVFCSQQSMAANEDDQIEMLLDLEVVGAIFVAGSHGDVLADKRRYGRLRRAGIPLCLVNGYSPDIDATFVSTDDVVSVELAVAHLYSLGHRRIALATGPERFERTRRLIEGFRRAMGERSLDLEGLVSSSLFTMEGGQAAGAALVQRGCSAVIAASDLMALGVLRAARAGGLVVPEDLSVVGFDDTPMAPYFDPPLTAVRQPTVPMGNAAVAALFDELRGLPVDRQEILFRPDLVVRSSTGAFQPRSGDAASGRER